jgi:hypothetical protein
MQIANVTIIVIVLSEYSLYGPNNVQKFGDINYFTSEALGRREE